MLHGGGGAEDDDDADDDNDEDDDNDDDEGAKRRTPKKTKKDQALAEDRLLDGDDGHLDESESDDDESESDDDDDDDDSDDDDEEDDESEEEDDESEEEEDALVMHAPLLIKSEEDLEFERAFASLMHNSMETSRSAGVGALSMLGARSGASSADNMVRRDASVACGASGSPPTPPTPRAASPHHHRRPPKPKNGKGRRRKPIEGEGSTRPHETRDRPRRGNDRRNGARWLGRRAGRHAAVLRRHAHPPLSPTLSHIALIPLPSFPPVDPHRPPSHHGTMASCHRVIVPSWRHHGVIMVIAR